MDALSELVARLLLGEGLPGLPSAVPSPWPRPVGVELVFYCVNCDCSVDRHAHHCPDCGQVLDWAEWQVVA